MNKNQENINTKTAYAYFQDMNNTLVNWAQAMDKNGIVSFEEFRFIAQGLSSEQIDGMRTNIVRDTKTQMQNNLTASLKIDATLMAIEENQNKYISELIAGEGGDEAMDQVLAALQGNPDLNKVQGYTDLELTSGYRIVTDNQGVVQYGADGEPLKEAIDGSLVNMWNKFIITTIWCSNYFYLFVWSSISENLFVADGNNRIIFF